MTINEISATLQIGFPILSILVLLPVVGIVAVGLLPGKTLALRVTLLIGIVELVLALLMLSSFKLGTAELQFVERIGGIYTLGIDGISALFIPLTALLTILASLTVEASVKHDQRTYLMAVLGLCATLMGAFAAADVLLFWVFLTLEMIPGYILIARYGTGSERKQAARHYAAVMVIASALLLAGLQFLLAETGTGSDLQSVLKASLPLEAQGVIFVLLCTGLAIKTPIFPLHSWLPRILEQGPVVGIGVFLVGIKIGTYGFVRIVISVLPEASAQYYWVLAGMASFGMVYGALIALAQTNLRRMLAYASVSHMGVVMLGLFSLNLHGLQGGLLQMLSIGLAVAALYFIAGFLHVRVGTPDSTRLGGLVHRAPLMALAFLVTALAAIGMPGTSGFNGEHLVVLGAYEVHWLMAFTVGLGTVLSAAYFLRYFQRAFMASPANDEVAGISDLDARERLISLVLVSMVFAVGLYTSPFLRLAEGSLTAMAEHVEARITADDAAHLATQDETETATGTIVKAGSH